VTFGKDVALFTFFRMFCILMKCTDEDSVREEEAVRLGKCSTVVKADEMLSSVTGLFFFSLTHPGPVKAENQKKCLTQQFSRKESYFKSLLGTCLCNRKKHTIELIIALQKR
jgi:hypothetical protein